MDTAEGSDGSEPLLTDQIHAKADKTNGQNIYDVERQDPQSGVRHTSPSRASTFESHHHQSASQNHRFSSLERKKLCEYESLDYLPPNSSVYKAWLRSQPHGLNWDRFFMMGSIATVIGIIGYLEFFLIKLFSIIKFRSVAWLIDHAGIFIAWVFNVFISLLLVAIATWTVVMVAPAAAGGGVAEVMAYLNGVHIPKIFNIKTLVVKFISCAAAVGSGLPVGPEGPMIHIGALIGSGLSQGSSSTLKFSTGLFERFRNPRDQREFVTAGAAIGVAVAFNAPIGGLLFAFEEVASFFSTALGWQTFFGCMLGVLVLNLCRSVESSLSGGIFGLFAGTASTVFYEVTQVVNNHVVAVVPAAVVGLCCGLAAVVFTMVNLKCSRLRSRYIGDCPRKRMAEPLIMALVFVTISMLLPQFFACITPTCANQQGASAPVCREGASPASGVTAEVGLLDEHYTCKPDINNGTGGASIFQPYNPLAILLDVPGDDAIRHLLTRGTHLQFQWAPLIVMLLVYFTGATLLAGTAIASGLFVPMLVIGCVIGRMVGLATVQLAAKWTGPESTGIFLAPSPWAWIDPGVFALFGAAGFMGGTTRLTMSLAVIMLEMSNDVRMLLPVLVTIGTAKVVADAMTPALYHAQLALKAVPYLDEAPEAAVSLDLVPVSSLMASPVVSFPERVPAHQLRHTLRQTSHNGFPVVRNTGRGQVFVGLVTRQVVGALLRHHRNSPRGASSGSTPTNSRQQHQPPSYGDISRQSPAPTWEQPFGSEQQLAVLQNKDSISGVVSAAASSVSSEDGHLHSESESEGADVIDLRPYMNTSAISVDECFSAERTYILLRTLGLRHITITDRFNCPQGMITRKDLLGFRLDEAARQYEMVQPHM